jgi:hypothetical protein
MKVVRFEYPKCRGLITYTGIGRDRRRKDTAKHVVDWLTNVQDADFEDIAYVIRDNAARWLRSISRVPERHTFVMAGFGSEGKAKLALISNFESLRARSSERATSSLTVTVSNTKKSSLARVTGNPSAVPREKVNLLRRTVDRDALNSALIRNTMVRLIKSAGSSPRFNNLISVQANAISLRPDGSGQHQLSQPLSVETYVVNNGSAIPSIHNLLRDLGVRDRAMLGASFATSESKSNYDHGRCKRAVYPGSGSETYDLTELSLPGSPPFQALAVADDGTILATSAVDGGRLHHYWLWRGNDDVQPILAGAENVSGVVAGGIDAAGRVFVATGGLGVPEGIIRRQGSDSRELRGASQGLPITLSAVSPTGWLAGTVEVNDDSTRADRAKPARWSPDGVLEINTGIYEGVGGSARSIASDGTTITWLHRNLIQTESYLWAPDGTMTRLIIPPYGLAIGITGSHDVVGIRLDGAERQAVRSTNHQTWEPLGLPPSWEPNHVSHTGLVAGHFQREGLGSPWVLRASTSLTTLSGYTHHHHRVVASAANGWLVGTATTERCSHALLWTRSS